MPITLDGQTVPMPKEFAPTVMKNAFEASVIGQLTNSEPLPLGDYVIPQYDGGFEVGVVGEAGHKPVGSTWRAGPPQEWMLMDETLTAFVGGFSQAPTRKSPSHP